MKALHRKVQEFGLEVKGHARRCARWVEGKANECTFRVKGNAKAFVPWITRTVKEWGYGLKAGLKECARWVKRYERPISVLGVVFFGLTFISGLIWALGADIESVAFLLGLCSSILFGLPQVSEFFLPTRKPVRDMTSSELLQLIKDSDPKKDWEGLAKQRESEFFFKEDPRLRFRAKYTDEGVHNRTYRDEWANRHLHPQATSYWYDLYYAGNHIDRFILVSIDDGRADVPPPDPYTGKIKLVDYRVAQIHDVHRTLDEYLVRSGLEVDEST